MTSSAPSGGAPHLLLVSAAPEAACPQEDVSLALAYFELMAQSAGLGTVWCGLAKMALELAPELKATVGLMPGHFYYTMLFGLPAVRYVLRSTLFAPRCLGIGG